MEYRILGTTGAKVSPICLGAMMFGDPADRDESHRILDTAREAGINFVDTANVYTRQKSDFSNEQNWPEQFEWLRQRLETLHKIFAPRIKILHV